MSILDFGLCDAIRFAFSGQQEGGFRLVEALLEYDHVYYRANELVTFIDNHDMPRFLSICSSHRSLEQALVLLFCLRGVPCIFYGTEQYLVNNTDGGNDPYNRPMMESWSSSSACYGLFDTLISVRRQNQALTFGSHRQIYVSEHVYAFIRSYRDYHALCILNKGPSTQITLSLGTHFGASAITCELTGLSFLVTDDQLSLTLDSGSAYLFSSLGQRVPGDVVATFQVNGIETRPGQKVVLTGDCPELGRWDLAQAYGMEYVNRNTWICEVGFTDSVNKPIRFKYVLVDHDGHSFVREDILPRQLLLPGRGRQKVDSIWQVS
jgi:cyclomaltodextrin glucanotransferase